MYIIYFIFTIFLCAASFLRMKRKGIGIRSLFGNIRQKDIPWQLILIVFYAGMGLKRGVRLLCLYVSHFVAPENFDIAIRLNRFSITYDFSVILIFLSVVIIAPLSEEFIFRGLIFQRWSVKWGITAGILTSSILFRIIHADMFIPERMISGAIYAIIYCKIKMLIAPIILHALNNFLVFINTVINDTTQQTTITYNVTVEYLWHSAVYMLLATPALLYFLKLPNTINNLPYVLNQKSIRESEKKD